MPLLSVDELVPCSVIFNHEWPTPDFSGVPRVLRSEREDIVLPFYEYSYLVLLPVQYYLLVISHVWARAPKIHTKQS